LGVDIPQPFDSNISGSMGSIGPVTVAGIPQPFATTVGGIPDTYHINIEKLPKIQVGLDPITVNPLTLHLDPFDLNLRLKEFPSIRTHVPADFTVGLTLLGIELLAVHLCGEAQLITEPYQPNPCERCGAERLPNQG
jgi:hypothetical protein